MSNCDNYEFAKSLEQQSTNSETPYSNLQYQYITDLNNGIYSNGGLTLIQFDLSSIYNSNSLIDMNRAYLAIPIQIATVGTAVGVPGVLLAQNSSTGQNAAWSYVGLKNSYTTLVHAAELQVGGQTVEQYQPYNSNYTYFKLCSSMSVDDMRTIGSTIGMGREIDNPESLRYNTYNSVPAVGGAVNGIASAGPFQGNGFVNNMPFGNANPNFGDQTISGAQMATGPYNNSYYYRLNKIIDSTVSVAGSGTTAGTQYGTSGLALTSQMQTEGKANFSFGSSGTVGLVNDVAIIRLGDILDSMRNLPLTKRFSGQLRLYLNTGMLSVGTILPGNPYCMSFNAGNTSFTNTCPLMVSALPAAAYAVTGGPINQITTSLSIGKFNGGTIGSVTIPAQSSGLLPSCRLYFPQVTLKPEKLRFYLDQGLNRKVNYTSYYFNQFAAISQGSSFSGVVQSQVRRPRGLLILPFVSPNTGASTTTTGSGNGTNLTLTGITSFADQLSPFSCAPCQTGAISLINIQVAVGGQNFFQNAIQYTWSQFQENTMMYEKLNGIDLGLKCGLFSEYNFENAYRCYYLDLSRGTLADELTDRTVSLSLTNNSNAVIDLYTFVEYFNEIEINVENGIVKR